MATTITLPDLAQGEVYAGIALNEDGTPSHHLILLEGEAISGNWQTQMDWAKSIGGELPTRQEQALLYANSKQQFKPAWYWSSEQHSSESGWAWCQDFHHGTQGSYRKTGELRARAVRRLPI